MVFKVYWNETIRYEVLIDATLEDEAREMILSGTLVEQLY